MTEQSDSAEIMIQGKEEDVEWLPNNKDEIRFKIILQENNVERKRYLIFNRD